ncbi:MAG: hypothetical protein Q9218_000264 [Villophora microphyllina]
MATTKNCNPISVPVIFLKTPLDANLDPYTQRFSNNEPSPTSVYEPHYVPVLDHSYDLTPIISLLSRSFIDGSDTRETKNTFPYGGLIFTSGRAVEAFDAALKQISCSTISHPSKTSAAVWRGLRDLAVPLYAVGPATATSLLQVRAKLPACWIKGGEEAGTGELLANLILEEHPRLPSTTSDEPDVGETMKPLLFLAGVKHRDIVPVTLKSHGIDVEEMIVYATAEAPSFPLELASALSVTTTAPIRWIVIFSSTGGESLLRALGFLDKETTRARKMDDSCWVDRKTFIASIGPTTSDYMKDTFGFEVDVCAAKPRPDSVRQGIRDFMRAKGWLS